MPEIAGQIIATSWRGVGGFVPPDGSCDDLIAAIERVIVSGAPERGIAGEDVVKTSIVPSPAVSDLTPREEQIAGMIERGLSNKEIARDLHIGVGTVKNHVHNILEKLQVRRRNQAAHRLRSGLVAM